MDRFGCVYFFFNNVGVVNGGVLVFVWELFQLDWDWVMGVNFYGVFYGFQIFVFKMLVYGEYGYIVNIVFIVVFILGGGFYGVSKYGVIKVSEVFVGDLKVVNVKIGVFVFCFGWVNIKIGDVEWNWLESMSLLVNLEGKGFGIDVFMSYSKLLEDLVV